MSSLEILHLYQLNLKTILHSIFTKNSGEHEVEKKNENHTSFYNDKRNQT